MLYKPIFICYNDHTSKTQTKFLEVTIMLKCFSKECTVLCAIGAATGIVAYKAAKTPKTRELAVSGLAKGIQVKDKVQEEIANLCEEAEEICSEAKEKAKADCDAPCDCDCGCEA